MSLTDALTAALAAANALEAELAAEKAARVDLSAQVVALAAEVQRLTKLLTPPLPPAPVEPPKPPVPVEPPKPVDPPPPVPQQFEQQPQNRRRLVFFDGWHRGGVYQRYQALTKWIGNTTTVLVRRENVTGSSADVWRPAKAYTLLIDGKVHATAQAPEGAASFSFALDLSDISPGWRRLDIGGLSDGETCPKWFAYRMVPGMTTPDQMPAVGGSYELSEGRDHAIALVPARYAPKPEPLPRKTYTSFGHAESTRLRTDLVVAGGHGSVYLPHVTDGIVNTCNHQAYYWEHMLNGRTPTLHLDGPRGVGTHNFGSHIEVGVGTQGADPNSAPMLAVYVCEPRRIIRVTEEGHITTLAGERHRAWKPGDTTPPETARTELVGNWDAVPERLRSFRELWGFVFDPTTLAVDTSAAPIVADGNRQPHTGNPVGYASDSQRDCVYRLEWDGKSHATPVRVSVLAELPGAFDVRVWCDEIIVSQQRDHRIVALNRDGTIKRVIVQRDPSLPGGASFAEATRRLWRQGTLDQVRAHPVLGPEGLYILPGDDWLYYGGQVQAQIRRVHLVTGEVQVYMPIETDGNSHFCKFALSDGTTGPRGSVFYQVWSNTNTRSADMSARLPDGTLWSLARVNSFNSAGYGSAVGVGGGRIYTSSSEYGLRKKYMADPIDAALFGAGQKEWKAMHGDLRFGPYGFHRDESIALPWGKSDALDYFLAQCGHAR